MEMRKHKSIKKHSFVNINYGMSWLYSLHVLALELNSHILSYFHSIYIKANCEALSFLFYYIFFILKVSMICKNVVYWVNWLGLTASHTYWNNVILNWCDPPAPCDWVKSVYLSAGLYIKYIMDFICISPQIIVKQWQVIRSF